MADDVTLNAASGTFVAGSDDVGGGRQIQIVKIGLGADGALDNLLDAGSQAGSASLPVALSTEDNAVLDVIAAGVPLVPNSTEADQALTVDATAGGVQFGALHASTTHVLWTCETAQCRVTFDGSAPTTTNGHPIEAGDSGVWAKALAVAAKFIRTGSTSAVVHASQLKV